MTLRPDAALPPDDVHDPLGEVRRQRRGHLVEEEQRWLHGQRSRQVDDPEGRERQVPDQLVEVEAGDAELRHPGAGTARRGVSVSVRLDRTSRSGISDGSW